MVVMVVDIVAGKGTGGNGMAREAGSGNGGREERPQLSSRGSLQHPKEKGAEGGFGYLPRIGARVGALLEFFCSQLLPFELGLK